MLLETLDHRLDDERQVGELYPFAFNELFLDPLAQRDEPAHVRLDHAPGVRRLALAQRHAVRYGPPDARELDDLVALVDRHTLRRGFAALQSGGGGPPPPVRGLLRGGSTTVHPPP